MFSFASQRAGGLGAAHGHLRCAECGPDPAAGMRLVHDLEERPRADTSEEDDDVEVAEQETGGKIERGDIRIEGEFAERKLNRVVADYTEWVVAQGLKALDVPPFVTPGGRSRTCRRRPGGWATAWRS